MLIFRLFIILLFGLLFNYSDPMKVDLLHIACEKGNDNEIIKLLDEGVDVNAKRTGMTPLMTLASIKNANIKIANILINRGASINETDNLGFTAFHFAASQGNYDLLRFLYEKGADIHANTKKNDTPLMLLICDRDRDNLDSYYNSLTFLLDKGVDVNKCNNDGRGALIEAVIEGDIKTINMLVERNAELNIIDGVTGNSALFWACLSNNASSILKIFIEHNADINIRNNYTCETPIHAAAMKGNLEVVELLIDSGADKDCSNFKGETALSIAKKKGYEKVVKYLLSKEAKDSGIPLLNCQYINEKLKLDQKKDDKQELYLKLLNTLSINCTNAITKWEENNSCFLSSDISSDIQASTVTFLWHYYFGNNDEKRNECIELINDLDNISLVLSDYLEQLKGKNIKKIYTLTSKLSNKAGLRFSDTGWPDEQYNKYWIYSIPSEYNSFQRYYYNNGILANISNYNKIILSYGSDLLILKDNDNIYSLKISFMPGMIKPNIILVKAEQKEKGIIIIPSRIETTKDYFCDDISSETVNPLTKLIYNRRDVIDTNELSIMPSTIVEFYINNKTKRIFNDYEILSESILQSLTLWQIGCIYCDRSYFSVIIINNRYYIDSSLFDLICYCRDNNLDFSSIYNDYLQGGPGEDFSTLELTKFHINMQPFIGYQDITLFNDHTLIEDIDKVFKNYVRYDIDLKVNNLNCTSNQDAIACADPKNEIELNLGSYIFTTNNYLLRNSFEISEYQFGFGSDKVDLLFVIVHEIGHVFRIRHLDQNIPSLDGRYNIMDSTYHPKGFCITRSNINMFGNAFINNWKFNLEKCEGLKFNKN